MMLTQIGEHRSAKNARSLVRTYGLDCVNSRSTPDRQRALARLMHVMGH